MKMLIKTLLIPILGLIMTSISIGQSVVDYDSAGKDGNGYAPASAALNNSPSPAALTDFFRSSRSGVWSDPTIWESSKDSLNWTSANLVPFDMSGSIVISTGDTVNVIHSIFINQVIVDSGAVLIVNGPGSDSSVVFYVTNSDRDYDMIVKGTVIAMGVPPLAAPFSVNAYGVIDFEPGSVYEHRQDGGGIPICIWKPGSTIKLTGIKTVVPWNKAQDYSNIIVDLPELTFHLNMGFQSNIISGDITILNTSTNRFVLVGPQTDTVREVTILGNIYQSAGNFNSHGTENPNSTAILHTIGDISVTGGNFSIVRGSQGGTGITTWYLHGSLSISDAATQNANPTGGKFVFTGPKEHFLSLNNVSFGAGGLPIQVDTATVNIGNSIIRGEGMFSLSPLSTLICSNSGGLDSAFQGTGAVTLSPDAGYVFNGISPQVTGTKLPLNLSRLVINNQAGVALSSDVVINNSLSVTGVLSLEGKTITLANDSFLTDSLGRVTGEAGKITATRDLNAPSFLNVAGLGAEISTAENLGMTTIERFHAPAIINGNNGITRQYHIIPTNISSASVLLRLYYNEAELDTISEKNLGIFSSVDGINWERRDGIINTDNNYAETNGILGASYWTLAYAQGLVSVDDNPEGIPTEYALLQNYPNPFNPATVIRFDLPEDSEVDLSIYNLLGEKVITLVSGRIEKGRYAKTLNAANLPSGVYIYKLSAGNKSFNHKMILLK